MVDIPITAAVVGGQQATADLDRLSARTKRAAAATEEQARALKKRNEELKRGVAAAGALSGGGGRVGGALSAGLAAGGLSGRAGVVAAGAGAAFAVASTSMQLLAQAIESSVGALRAEAEARGRVAKIIDEGGRTERAGALAWGEAKARDRLGLQAVGGPALLAQADAMRHRGVRDAESGVGALARGGAATFDSLASMELAARTGLVTAQEAAEQILKGARSAEEVLSAALERQVTGADLETMLARVGSSALGQQSEQIARTRAEADDVQRVRFESGEALKAAREELRKIQDPGGVAIGELVREAGVQTRLLEGIYDRMSPLEAFADALANGPNGVAAQLNRATRDEAALLNALPGAAQ